MIDNDSEWERLHPNKKRVFHQISDKLGYEWREYCRGQLESGRKVWPTICWPQIVDSEMKRVLDRDLYKDAADKCDIYCIPHQRGGKLVLEVIYERK